MFFLWLVDLPIIEVLKGERHDGEYYSSQDNDEDSSNILDGDTIRFVRLVWAHFLQWKTINVRMISILLK